MASRKATILAVDDDVHMLRLMQRVLELEGYSVLKASSGKAAQEALLEGTPDLILLDILMPGDDGYTICRQIREFSPVPIVMVTAKSEVEDKVKGLEAGADDFVTKPFSAQELVARIKAVLRRSQLRAEPGVPEFRSHDLVVDFARHKVTLGGQELVLTATEYKLLRCLARQAGRVLTPDQILEQVWGEGYSGEHHILRVNIGRLRRKLGDDVREPRFISTKVGMGYMFLV